MSRISLHAVAAAIRTVRAVDFAQKAHLLDEVFRTQPNLLASVAVQKQMGVSLEKIEFLVCLLLLCFQAMKESGVTWPLITEEDQDRQMERYVATVKSGAAKSRQRQSSALQTYIDGHPEQPLLAFVMSETANWSQGVRAEESDKYVMLAAANIVECVAHVEIPEAKKRYSRSRR